MNYFDLHCDTAYEMYHKHEPLGTNRLAVSLDGYDAYEKKVGVFAVWSENTRSANDIYGDFFSILDNLKTEIENNNDRAILCTDIGTLKADDNRLKVIPAVEGSRLLEKDLSRLDILREMGVRVLTLAWGGECEACGAYDTDVGLTDFGFRVVERCEELGIILDVSHLSEKGFWDLANVAKKPFIATHSSAEAICSHPRNLNDTQIRTILTNGGIIGLNLVGKHLSKTFEQEEPTEKELVYETVLRHVAHFLEKGSTTGLCFGCDMDGTTPLCGLETVDKVKDLADVMRLQGAQEQMIENVFYNNAMQFFIKNF